MPGSGCFIFAWVQISRRTVVVVWALGPLCADAQTWSSQTLTNGLCETTAIDIYLISPHPSTVSAMATHHPLSFLFLFTSLGMGDARGPLAGLSYRPTHRCRGAEEREGEGERETERGEGHAKGFGRCEETHTSLCFHLSAWWTIMLATWLRKKGHVFLCHSQRCNGNRLIT